MAAVVDLTIAGIDIPNAEHASDLTVNIESDGGYTYRVRGNGSVIMLTGPRFGKRKLSINAKGWYPPALDSVDWTQGITISYKDLALDDASSTIIVRTPGPRYSYDIRRCATTWTLEGREV